MLHGAYGSWPHFVRNINAFSHDHRVLIPDIPGYGRGLKTTEYEGCLTRTIVQSGTDDPARLAVRAAVTTAERFSVFQEEHPDAAFCELPLPASSSALIPNTAAASQTTRRRPAPRAAPVD